MNLERKNKASTHFYIFLHLFALHCKDMAAYKINFALYKTINIMERMANNENAYAARRIPGIRSSVKPGSDRIKVPSGAAHQVSYGDRIFVRVANLQRGWRTEAEFELCTVSDMSDIYGELRYRTRGCKGLMRLYVRNATRGWSFEQPFKLYGQTPEPAPATSVTRRPTQPARSTYVQGSLFDDCTTKKRKVPDSIRTFTI